MWVNNFTTEKYWEKLPVKNSRKTKQNNNRKQTTTTKKGIYKSVRSTLSLFDMVRSQAISVIPVSKNPYLKSKQNSKVRTFKIFSVL